MKLKKNQLTKKIKKLPESTRVNLPNLRPGL
jgi:hypothetical protein